MIKLLKKQHQGKLIEIYPDSVYVTNLSMVIPNSSSVRFLTLDDMRKSPSFINLFFNSSMLGILVSASRKAEIINAEYKMMHVNASIHDTISSDAVVRLLNTMPDSFLDLFIAYYYENTTLRQKTHIRKQLDKLTITQQAAEICDKILNDSHSNYIIYMIYMEIIISMVHQHASTRGLTEVVVFTDLYIRKMEYHYGKKHQLRKKLDKHFNDRLVKVYGVDKDSIHELDNTK